MASSPTYNVRLPADLRAAFEALAAKMGEAPSVIVRQAIREYLDRAST